MFAYDLPKELLELVKEKLEKDRKNEVNEEKEKILINPTLDDPSTVRNQ